MADVVAILWAAARGDMVDSACNGGLVDNGFVFDKKIPSKLGRISANEVRPHDQIECPSLFVRSCSSCEDKPFVTGDRFVARFAHQVTSDADAEVEAFNAYAEWCKDQAQDDGHHQETLDASIASTNAAIENFTAKAESVVRVKGRGTSANLRLSFLTL